jgi:M6 family metalloprotease-like protein
MASSRNIRYSIKAVRLIIAVFAVMLLQPLWQKAEARPAYPWPVTVTQPDGTKVQIRIHGDEFGHYMTDMSGHAVTRSSDGTLYYALYGSDGSVQSSGYAVGDKKAPASILSASRYIPREIIKLKALQKRQIKENGLRSLKPQSIKPLDDTTKQMKVLVILGEYSDVAYTHTWQQFENLFNKEGYNTYGSVSDYFSDQLGEYYDFEFDVATTIVRLSKKRAYYGSNDDEYAYQALMEACQLADDAGVDFSQYDSDGDGKVDAVSLIMAGNGEESGGGEDCIWSHQWNLEYANEELILDGKQIAGYNILCECRGTESNIIDIGVFCHEFSHNLGLDDIYDTDDTESGGYYEPTWMTTSVMATGCYCYDGDCPIGYNAMDYYVLGLGSSTTISEAGDVTLQPISGSDHPYLVMETGTENEVFLIEYKTADGWNAYLDELNYGVGVYHIDMSQNDAGAGTDGNFTAEQRWTENVVNANPNHPCADMITYKNATDALPYFPVGSTTFLNHDSNTKYSAWSGDVLTYKIGNISLGDEAASFTLIEEGSVLDMEPVLNYTDIFQDAAIINWSCSDTTFDGSAYISCLADSATGDAVEVTPYDSSNYAYLADGLVPATRYTLAIYFTDSAGNKSKVYNGTFTTNATDSTALAYIILPESSRNSDGSFISGSRLPLRVANLHENGTITWTLNDTEIEIEDDCYWTITESGILKASIVYEDGSTEKIIKTLTVQ